MVPLRAYRLINLYEGRFPSKDTSTLHIKSPTQKRKITQTFEFNFLKTPAPLGASFQASSQIRAIFSKTLSSQN